MKSPTDLEFFAASGTRWHTDENLIRLLSCKPIGLIVAQCGRLDLFFMLRLAAEGHYLMRSHEVRVVERRLKALNKGCNL